MIESIVLISDPRVTNLAVQDNQEPLENLRLTTNFVFSERYAKDNPIFTYVRQGVATRLKQAASQLPAGYNFLFSEGLRPLSFQKKLFADCAAFLREQNPDWDEDTVIKTVSQYVAPPTGVPPHSTGGAFDLTLLDANGHEVDMGSPIDDLSEDGINRNITDTNEISDQAKQNRALLKTLLSNVGFVNYPYEWWHWSYGEKYWAYSTNQSHALYGSVEQSLVQT